MIEVLIVNQAEVPRLLPMKECVDVMARAFASLARGEADMPVRQILWMAEKRGALGLMPAHLGGLAALGLKAVTFFPGNEGTDLDSHQGAVLLFETGRGRLLAIIDATSITAVRTAAVSGLATRLLAKPDASDLALVGSGVEARTHLEAMLAVRTIKRIRVASKTFERAKSFADRESKRHGISSRRPASRSRRPSTGADIVCTVTSSPRAGRSGAPGSRPASTSTPSGSSVATARELDSEAVARSRLFVDQRRSALEEAGDFLLARADGAVGDDHIVGELGELVTGQVPGRQSRRRHHALQVRGPRDRGRRRGARTSTRRRAGSGLGKFVEFGGGRHDAD